MSQHRLIYNSDGTNIFIVSSTPEQIYRHVDEVANSQVTTFMICPNGGQVLYYPSSVGEMYGSKLSDEELEAYPNALRMARNLRRLVARGYDPIGLVVNRCREKGLETFITFRMNDLHDINNPQSPLVSDFYREHPEWHLNEPDWGWGGLAPNFAIPEVRDHRFQEIQEVVERYDIDGLELDFQRFPHYFSHKPGVAESHIPDMTELVGRIFEMLNRVGRERGKKILLAVRVPSTLEGCRRIGLDPVNWYKQGWLDFLTVAPFLRTLFKMPINEFKMAMPGLPIYATIEFTAEYVASSYQRIMTPEMYRGAADSLYACGADGISLFNMFCSREYGQRSWEPPFEVLRQIGDPETLRNTERLYIVDQRSDFDQYVDVVPPLPKTLKSDEKAFFSIMIKTPPTRSEKAMLHIKMSEAPPMGKRGKYGYESVDNTIYVDFNGVSLSPSRTPPGYLFYHYNLDTSRDFLVPNWIFRTGENVVSLTASFQWTVTNIELAIIPIRCYHGYNARVTPET
ncbi:family 10 glycosylhydrolase [Candidatus Bathyarchaeota archaeon]|nr:family 10 glycosylhydrolase [Candidatus Bathyarchaeota archaeon]